MKFLEEHFKTLSFGTLADLTTARFNKIHESVDCMADEMLQKFYADRSKTRAENIEKASVQENHRYESQKRLLDQVRN